MSDRSQWQATADALQIPLEDLLTVVSFETGGTFDPLQKGPTTKWGTHEGLIQFGDPQGDEHGAVFDQGPEAALASQLGPEGAIVNYMLASGFVPGEHEGIDIYSTINAGAPGRYSASDTAAGGTKGDVYDKWTNQMTDHRNKARKMLGLGEVEITANSDGSISRNKGVNHNASANNGGEKKVSKDEGPAYKALPFGIAGNAQAGLADKIGGERMAGMGAGLFDLSSQIMNGEMF